VHTVHARSAPTSTNTSLDLAIDIIENKEELADVA
jgi:hypothetical protein